MLHDVQVPQFHHFLLPLVDISELIELLKVKPKRKKKKKKLEMNNYDAIYELGFNLKMQQLVKIYVKLIICGKRKS